MEFGLSAEQVMLQESVARFLDRSCPLERVRQHCEQRGQRADDVWSGLCDLGIPALIIAEEHGGIGCTLLDAALVAETLGSRVAPAPFGSTAVMAPLAIAAAGSAEQQARWLPALAEGKLVAGAALSAAASNRLNDPVRANGATLRGRALFVLDFAADIYLVADNERKLYIVEATDPNLHRTVLSTIDRTRSVGELMFEDAAAELLPGSNDPQVCARVIDAGRIALAADTLGAASTMLERAVAYSKQRVQFGRPVGSFQAVKHLCAEMAADLEPCRAMLWYAAHAFDALPQESPLNACHAKAHISEVGTRVARTSTEVHGGIGFTDELGLHLWFKRIGANRQLLGGPDQLREEAAEMQGLGAGNRGKDMGRTLFLVAGLVVALGHVVSVGAEGAGEATRFVDHSLVVAPEFPCTWPTQPFPRFQITHERTIGPDSAYNVDVLLIDGNTGTQMDVPPHSVARPELKREKSGPLGLTYTDKIEAWQFGGEACVVDVRDLLDQAPNGISPLVHAERVQRFERQHRPVRFGDVVLFRSDYTDKYYRPYPAGNRFIAAALDRKAPGFPDPDPECMEYLAKRGVMTVGTDSASMGPLPDGEPTHFAGLKHGMIWTESATNLGALPATGGFYCMLGPKHKDGPYGATRAFSIVGGELPRRLIDSAKNKRAIDLSPTLAANMPLTAPGIGTGQHRQTYLKIDFLYSDYLDLWHHTHLMDSMAGTHLVPPSFALPPPSVKPAYAPEVRLWLAEYEKKYGPRGESKLTTEQVPLDWTCGPARVVDVRSLIGSTTTSNWPASPEILPQHLQAYEREQGGLKAGDVVLFHTGHLDKHLRPQPNAAGVWTDPILGKSEGWPAPGPDAIVYLKSKGIRCVATDAPDLGGVDPKRALMTYWALGSREMVGVEFTHQAGKVPSGGYFLFAPLKIRDCHGGPGRAIVLY